MIPPVWINVRAGWVWIPLPVVLLWPVLLLGWLVLGLLLTAIALSATDGKVNFATLGQLWPVSWQMLCSVRGTRVEVEQSNFKVVVWVV